MKTSTRRKPERLCYGCLARLGFSVVRAAEALKLSPNTVAVWRESLFSPWRKENRRRINRESIRRQRLNGRAELDKLRQRVFRSLNRQQVIEWGRRADAKRRDSEKRREWRRAWRINKLKNDPSFHISTQMRIRISNALRRANGTKKCAPLATLLGCSIQEFRDHLARLFQDGMGWHNYGKWHIDHIRPCASFDLKDPEQQKMCFNYNNCQPLWASDNQRKGAVAA